MLLHADGAVVTIRRHPELVQVVPDLDLAAGTISVRLPDGTVACSPLGEARAPVSSTLSGSSAPDGYCPAPWPMRCPVSPASRFASSSPTQFVEDGGIGPKASLGVIASVERPGSVQVGDEVIVGWMR